MGIHPMKRTALEEEDVLAVAVAVATVVLLLVRVLESIGDITACKLSENLQFTRKSKPRRNTKDAQEIANRKTNKLPTSPSQRKSTSLASTMSKEYIQRQAETNPSKRHHTIPFMELYTHTKIDKKTPTLDLHTCNENRHP